jgi:ABC-type Fe3+-hydroxamate transport system substrate-binding protein
VSRLAGAVLALTVAAAAHAAPVRVAALLPYVAEAVGRLDGQAMLVAAVRRDLHAPPPAPLVDLGTPHAPSFEALAAVSPDVVVGERALHGPQEQRLARTGAEVVLVDSGSVDATLDGLLAVAARVHATAAMGREVAAVRAALAALALPAPVPALIVFGTPGNFLVVTERTWLGDLARRLALRNVAAAAGGAERHPGFVQMSDETLVALRPELVLLVAHGDPAAIRAELLRRLAPGGPWGALGTAAVRGVHVLPGHLFATNPGLALDDAARHLRALAAEVPSRR